MIERRDAAEHVINVSVVNYDGTFMKLGFWVSTHVGFELASMAMFVTFASVLLGIHDRPNNECG